MVVGCAIIVLRVDTRRSLDGCHSECDLDSYRSKFELFFETCLTASARACFFFLRKNIKLNIHTQWRRAFWAVAIFLIGKRILFARCFSVGRAAAGVCVGR